LASSIVDDLNARLYHFHHSHKKEFILFGHYDDNSRKDASIVANIQLDKRYIVRKLQLPFMFMTNRKRPFLMTSLVSAVLVIFMPSSSGYLSITTIRDVELLVTDGSIMVPTVNVPLSGGGNGNSIGNGSGIGGVAREPTEPNIALLQFNPPVTASKPPQAPSINPPQIPTPILTIGPTLTQTPNLTPTALRPTRTNVTNVNNVNINEIQNFEGAVRSTPDCAPVAASIALGPSEMEAGRARILAAFDPCVLTNGTALMNLPDEQGIQLVAANVQAGYTVQSAIVPLKRIVPVTQGQVLFGADLNEQVTGPDQARGERANLNGTINALFLWNNSGQSVELVGGHNASLNALLKR
jgi:hypothetical protein